MNPWTEAETRQEIIDKRLALAAWNVKDPSQVTEELDIDLTKGKPKRAAGFLDFMRHVLGLEVVESWTTRTAFEAYSPRRTLPRFSSSERAWWLKNPIE